MPALPGRNRRARAAGDRVQHGGSRRHDGAHPYAGDRGAAQDPAGTARRRLLPRKRWSRRPKKNFIASCGPYGVTPRGEDNGRECSDDSHPYIHVDRTQCILCSRCVRICEELQGQSVWKLWNRGAESRIVPDLGGTLMESTCASCGACVDTCPTGALEDKALLPVAPPLQWTRTTCPYCGTGCELNVGTSQGHDAESQAGPRRPGQQRSPVLQGALCLRLRVMRRTASHVPCCAATALGKRFPGTKLSPRQWT